MKDNKLFDIKVKREALWIIARTLEDMNSWLESAEKRVDEIMYKVNEFNDNGQDPDKWTLRDYEDAKAQVQAYAEIMNYLSQYK